MTAVTEANQVIYLNKWLNCTVEYKFQIHFQKKNLKLQSSVALFVDYFKPPSDLD